MGNSLNAIPVRDGNGDQLTVYEVWSKPRLFGLMADQSFKLCSGEPVEPLDESTFIIAKTGERLIRVA